MNRVDRGTGADVNTLVSDSEISWQHLTRLTAAATAPPLVTARPLAAAQQSQRHMVEIVFNWHSSYRSQIVQTLKLMVQLFEQQRFRLSLIRTPTFAARDYRNASRVHTAKHHMQLCSIIKELAEYLEIEETEMMPDRALCQIELAIDKLGLVSGILKASEELGATIAPLSHSRSTHPDPNDEVLKCILRNQFILRTRTIAYLDSLAAGFARIEEGLLNCAGGIGY